MRTSRNGVDCFRSVSLLLIIVLVGVEGCAKTTIRQGPPTPLEGAVRFTILAPGAKKVFLVGSFNGWAKGATPMKAMNAAGLWSVDVPLKEGEHTFMYLIDGVQWVTPPLAEDFVTDGFGQTNGIVVVR